MSKRRYYVIKEGGVWKEAILAWNNAVCTLLYEFGEANYG